MKINRKIRLVICYSTAILVLLGTFLASAVIIENILGDGAYSVKNAASTVLSLIAAAYVGTLLFPGKEEEEYTYDEGEKAEAEAETVTATWEKGEIDESAYPELFKRDVKENDEGEASGYPDIKKIIGEQKAEADIVQETVDTKTAWDEFVGMRDPAEIKSDLYADIPAELPEDYVPNYVTEEVADEEEAEEEAPEGSVKKLIIKAAVAVALCALAVILPARLMTVYTEDSIVKYGLTGKTEYKYADAHHCTVGVKISGDVSLKVNFGDKDFELVVDGDIISDEFADKFESPHSYAARCDRIMKNAGVDKNISNLNSLNRVPEDQMRYVNEITDGYLENNK